MKSLLAVFFILILLNSPLFLNAEEEPSPELIAKGEELFMNKEPLGTKFACILCHKGKKAIEKVKVLKLGDKLPDTINGQLMKQAKGKAPLPKDGEEMKALAAYIKYKHSI
jgi:cytochrome c